MKSIITALLFILATASYVLMPSTASATSVISLTDAQLVEYSDYIIHATILQTKAVKFDEHTILTEVTVQVNECYKMPDEACPHQFVFYTRGGNLEDIQQIVPGEYHAQAGMEVVAFLEKIKRYEGRPMVLGLTQGAFEMRPATMMRSEPHPLRRGHEFVKTPTGFDEATTIEDLRSRILEQMHRK